MRTESSSSLDYIAQTFVKESPQRQLILQAIAAEEKSGIQISAVEGQMLKLFASMVGAKKIVEIGTLFGYSTSWWLEAVGVQGRVWSFEKSPEHHQYAKDLLSAEIQGGRLSLLLGDALENLPRIESEGPFDLIFIDANKSAYVDYLKWADQHLREGGLIIADNTLLFGLVCEEQAPKNLKKAWAVMKEFNQRLAENPNYVSVLVPTKEGLTVAYKRQA